MSVRFVPMFGAVVVALGILVGCGGPPSLDDAAEAASEWPLAGIDIPTAEDSVASDGLAVEGAGPNLEQGSTGETEAGPPLERPEMDMDATGPMIHTPPGFTDFPDARFPRPEHVRGLYVNAWAAGSHERMTRLLDIARRTEVNSLVIDIKDATGYISHETEVALAHEIGATEERRIRDLPALLDRLEAEGIYPIARIVVVKDPILSTFRPELAVQDTAGGLWMDGKESLWLNPFSEEMWAYHAEIAREVAEIGFPEIQWDYVRFPDAPQSELDRAVFAGREGRERVDAIRGFLVYVRDALSDLPVRSTIDVFGVTTSFRRDVGIGQLWETFIDVVDVALPMVYPSHYWEGSFGIEDPNGHPYEIVRAALNNVVRRSAAVESAGLTRPWLQDFSLGEPIYGAAEVRAQIQGVYDAGIQEWILWNPGARYTEAALEPVGGFEREPLVRVAGLLTPVSRRQLVIDSVAALPVPTDSLPTTDDVVPDTATVRSDTLPPPLPGDTISPVERQSPREPL